MARVAAQLPERRGALADRVRVREIVWLLLAAASVVAGWRALRWGLENADPRRATVRAIRAEASPTRDILVVTDEAPELLAAASPLPALSGSPPLNDLTPFRRLYVLAPNDGALLPYETRLGAPVSQPGPGAMRWDLNGLGVVRFDLLAELLSGTVVAHRDGGPIAGPCTRVGSLLHCHSSDDWNHVRAEMQTIGGAQVHCVFAHPQADSRLVIEVPHLPRARTVVGFVALDDRAYFPQGAPVTNAVRFVPDGGGATIERTIIAPNRRGATPYRIELGGHPGHLSFTITTPNAGARQYCFTAEATE